MPPTSHRVTSHCGQPEGAAQRDEVAQLLVACPHRQDNPSDCPMCRIRKLSLTERFRWARHLTLAELEQLRTHHYACLQCQQAGNPLPSAHALKLPGPPRKQKAAVE